MTIRARFASSCPRCHNPIRPGDMVNWAHGQKAVHTTCPPAVADPEPARIPIENAGVYVLPDGTIAKVKANREKTRTYALRWVPGPANRVTVDHEHATGEYQYESGLVQTVAAHGRKMTLEEARAFTLLYGECVRCGRTLTDPKSIDRSMGPVCIKYFSDYRRPAAGRIPRSQTEEGFLEEADAS